MYGRMRPSRVLCLGVRRDRAHDVGKRERARVCACGGAVEHAGISIMRPSFSAFCATLGRGVWQGYRKLLTGNGLQPGYPAILLFEFTVQKIRPGRGAARPEQQEPQDSLADDSDSED